MNKRRWPVAFLDERRLFIPFIPKKLQATSYQVPLLYSDAYSTVTLTLQ